jgi:hypothetical protein
LPPIFWHSVPSHSGKNVTEEGIVIMKMAVCHPINDVLDACPSRIGLTC